MPAILPLAPADRSARQRELLAPVVRGEDEVPNLFSAVVNNPDLYAVWAPFCLKLLGASALDKRERELVILAVAAKAAAEYEWAHHVGIGRRAGLSEDELSRLASGSRGGWNEPDGLLLAAVDQLCTSYCIEADTLTALQERLSTDQLVELPMLVGHYVLLAYLLRSHAVPLEREGLPALGSINAEGA